MRLNRRSLLALSASLALLPSLAHAQTVLSTFTEDFEDGNAASRWDFLARESNSAVDPSTVTADGTVDFNSTISANQWRSSGANPLANVPANAAGGLKAVRIQVNDGDANARLAKAAITPKLATVGTDYRMSLDTWMSYSDPAVAGSTEIAIYGLNTDTTPTPTRVVGPALAALAGGGAAVNGTTGYGFAMTNEGGNSQDSRIYSAAESNDDGALYYKRNAAWTGGYNELYLDPTTGVYTAGSNTLPDSNFNSLHANTFSAAQGFPIAGTPGNKWVGSTVVQRGRIVNFIMNGQVFNTLFTTDARSGKVSVGAYDGSVSIPAVAERPLSYFLFDNIKVDTLSAAPTNALSTGDTYATLNSGGTVVADGAYAMTGLTFDTAGTTLNGTGAVTLGGEGYAAIYAGGGNHVVNKPVVINSAIAVYVDQGQKLTLNSVSYGTGSKDFHKVGRGTLEIQDIKARSLTITSGTVKLLSGPSYLNSIVYGYSATAANGDATLLDVGRSIVAVDYLAGPIASGGATLSPLSAIANRLNTGFNGGAWNGPGIISSDVVAAGSNYTIRLAEASSLGYTDGSIWAGGYTIDATTVLFGFTFTADSNLDQTVNFNDLLSLAANYNTSGLDPFTSWTKGDSTGDGSVNFDDLLVLAANYNQTVTGSLGGDWALAQSLVPEPTSLAAIGAGAAALLGRRRRR